MNQRPNIDVKPLSDHSITYFNADTTIVNKLCQKKNKFFAFFTSGLLTAQKTQFFRK